MDLRFFEQNPMKRVFFLQPTPDFKISQVYVFIMTYILVLKESY